MKKKTADSVQLPFEMVSGIGPRSRSHWRHLVIRLCVAAMTGSATTGGDAACSQITLGNLFQFKYD